MVELFIVFGTRPQYVKLGALHGEFRNQGFSTFVCDTGQHYDHNMSEVFVEEFELLRPTANLSSGGLGANEMLGQMIIEIGHLLQRAKPLATLVIGDTTSTLAGALASVNLGIPVIHLEAGLRSQDLSMPEERNRVITDRIASLNLTPTANAQKNLVREGLEEKSYFVGDVMLDLLRNSVATSDIDDTEAYAYLSLHRQATVDNSDSWDEICNMVKAASDKLPIKWPVHPRSSELGKYLSKHIGRRLILMDPVSYKENIKLLAKSDLILTDSGGVQKEAYFLRKRCITLRPSTEWTETLSGGWNNLVSTGVEMEKVLKLKHPDISQHDASQFGDGHAAKHAARAIRDFLRDR